MTDVVFVVDPEGRAPATGLLQAVHERGARTWAARTPALEIVDGRARCRVDPLRNGVAPTRLWLDEAAAIVVCLRPPLTELHRTATLVLDLVDPARTALINAPAGLRAGDGLALRFPGLGPPTLVSADPAALRTFVAEHRVVVAAPVGGCVGSRVLRLDRHDPNLPHLADIVTAAGTRAAVLQPYLRETTAGTTRVHVVDGEPVAAVRHPPADAGPAVTCRVTDRDREICAGTAPALVAHGIHFAGLDLIGRYLVGIDATGASLGRPGAPLAPEVCAEIAGKLLDGTFLSPVPAGACPAPAGTR